MSQTQDPLESLHRGEREQRARAGTCCRFDQAVADKRVHKFRVQTSNACQVLEGQEGMVCAPDSQCVGLFGHLPPLFLGICTNQPNWPSRRSENCLRAVGSNVTCKNRV